MMACGAIGYNLKSDIVIMQNDEKGRGITQHVHDDKVLRAPLGGIARAKRDIEGDCFCVGDNAGVHGQKDTRQDESLCNNTRVEMDIYGLFWPVNSPDLILIENVWRIMKQKLRSREPQGGRSLPQLEDAL